MTQQGAFFVGLISRLANVIGEAAGVDIWVMDPLTETVESPRSLQETAVLRVRGVNGVAEADPFLQAQGSILTPAGSPRPLRSSAWTTQASRASRLAS